MAAERFGDLQIGLAIGFMIGIGIGMLIMIIIGEGRIETQRKEEFAAQKASAAKEIKSEWMNEHMNEGMQQSIN